MKIFLIIILTFIVVLLGSPFYISGMIWQYCSTVFSLGKKRTLTVAQYMTDTIEASKTQSK